MSHFTPSKDCAVNARFSVLLHSVPADQRVMLVEAVREKPVCHFTALFLRNKAELLTGGEERNPVEVLDFSSHYVVDAP